MSHVRILHISDLHLAKHPDKRDFFDYEQISAATFSKKPLEIARFIKERWYTIFSNKEEHRFAASYAPAKLRSLKAEIKKLKNSEERLDVVVITGDIATTGRDADLEAARNILFVTIPEEEANQIEEEEVLEEEKVSRFSIEDLAGTIYLLPGNHDRYDLRSLGGVHIGFRPGGEKFRDYFSNYWNDDVMSYRVIERDNFVTGIFGADFSLNSYNDCLIPRYSNGFAQGNVLQKADDDYKLGILGKLIQQTKEFSNKAEYAGKRKFIIWAIHFTPDNPAYVVSPESRLLNSNELILAAEDCGVSLILSGHIHKTFETTLENTSARLFVAGSATQYFEENGNFFQLITIEDENSEPVRTNYHFEGRIKGGSFIEDW